jgi:hypothetical protein
MIRKTLIGVVVAGALALPTAAAAETSTIAVAKRGSLNVLSSVVFTSKGVDMMGGWFNTNRSCLAERRLRVSVEFTRTRLNGSHAATVFDRVTGRVMNCAEGGPNFGFQFLASDFSRGLACPNGRWRPGRYDFKTRTRHLASGVVSVATLSLTRRTAC